jgi:AcrR family transcriptional regulator
MAMTQEERKAETRRRLLDAAADEFGAKGFHGVSADSVADAADRTSGAVYAHFGNKVGLLLALLTEGALETGRQIKDGIGAAGDTDQRLDAMWQSFIGNASAHDNTWMLLEHELWLFAARNPEARDLLAARFTGARGVMAESFEDWAEESGTSLPLPSADLATLVFALLMGLEMQHRVDPDAVSPELGAAALQQLFR